jgi:hypothetical protein
VVQGGEDIVVQVLVPRIRQEMRAIGEHLRI